MTRTPVKWIGIGISTLVLAVIVLFGLFIFLTVAMAYQYNGVFLWRGVLIGLLVLALPLGLLKLGKAADAGWAKIGRS